MTPRKAAPPTRERGRDAYHHGNLPEALVLAARRLVRERGAKGFSLADVCRAAGVSVAAPYRHFASREELLAALAARGFEELGAALSAALEEGDGIADALARMAGAYLAFARRRPAEYALMFANSAGVLLPEGTRTRAGPTAYDRRAARGGEAHRHARHAQQLGSALFRLVVARLAEQASTPAERALFAGDGGRRTVSAFWALCHGVAALGVARHLDREWLDPALVVDRLVAPWLAGLVGRDAR
ncbi:MAG: helix-turn-helix domain-containing protein [Gemmatimonadales bacterium]|nr:helix-turn-helix domain-containing protein [Gemmatimonadales bacterium]